MFVISSCCSPGPAGVSPADVMWLGLLDFCSGVPSPSCSAYLWEVLFLDTRSCTEWAICLLSISWWTSGWCYYWGSSSSLVHFPSLWLSNISHFLYPRIVLMNNLGRCAVSVLPASLKILQLLKVQRLKVQSFQHIFNNILVRGQKDVVPIFDRMHQVDSHELHVEQFMNADHLAVCLADLDALGTGMRSVVLTTNPCSLSYSSSQRSQTSIQKSSDKFCNALDRFGHESYMIGYFFLMHKDERQNNRSKVKSDEKKMNTRSDWIQRAREWNTWESLNEKRTRRARWLRCMTRWEPLVREMGNRVTQRPPDQAHRQAIPPWWEGHVDSILFTTCSTTLDGFMTPQRVLKVVSWGIVDAKRWSPVQVPNTVRRNFPPLRSYRRNDDANTDRSFRKKSSGAPWGEGLGESPRAASVNICSKTLVAASTGVCPFLFMPIKSASQSSLVMIEKFFTRQGEPGVSCSALESMAVRNWTSDLTKQPQMEVEPLSRLSNVRCLAPTRAFSVSDVTGVDDSEHLPDQTGVSGAPGQSLHSRSVPGAVPQ